MCLLNIHNLNFVGFFLLILLANLSFKFLGILIKNITGTLLKTWNNLFLILVMLYESKGATGHFRIQLVLIALT